MSQGFDETIGWFIICQQPTFSRSALAVESAVERDDHRSFRRSFDAIVPISKMSSFSCMQRAVRELSASIGRRV